MSCVWQLCRKNKTKSMQKKDKLNYQHNWTIRFVSNPLTAFIRSKTASRKIQKFKNHFFYPFHSLSKKNRFRCTDDRTRTLFRKYFTRKFLRIFFLFSLQCLNPKLHVCNFTILFFSNVKWYRWKFNWKWNCFASIISIFLCCVVFVSHLKWSRFLISWARKNIFVRFAKWKWIYMYSSVFMFSVAVPCCVCVHCWFFFLSFSSSLLIQFELTAVVQYMCVQLFILILKFLRLTLSLHCHRRLHTHTHTHSIRLRTVYNIVVDSHSTFRVKML